MAAPRILITNDDGIHAPGILLLEKIAAAFSDDVWVVAPETEQSGAAHSFRLPIPSACGRLDPNVTPYRARRRIASSSPATISLRTRRPDLLLSGVNRGLNLAEDIIYSGTVAAAMEGTLLGIKSIAMSQCFPPGSPVPWETAERHLPRVLKHLMA